ncbi:hypothetical protein IEO21_07236 [Rhodonia placenta]|uniref:Uncharacterized protein n=1 Tax=Rhodonia placenta TaxID=104341 RepID=A0A8H7NYR1_9APHY|nr:hypothetical protein IEO21_07236 [Postia placenta]
MLPSPPRRRPVCHACGTPMAGHKRPNGSPICPPAPPPPPPRLPPTPVSARRPQPLQRTVAVQEFEIPPDGVYRRRNPNWVDRRPVAQPIGGDDRHNSWDPTEPAESERGVGRDDDENPFIDGNGQEDNASSSSSRSSSTSSSSSSSSSASSAQSSRPRRTMSQALINSIPLASLFSSPSDDIPAISRVARRANLAMGLIRRPRQDAPPIKSEGGGRIHGANMGRQNSWWVVMGRDKGAVSHLMDVHERDERGQQDEELDSAPNVKVGAYPVDPRSISMTFIDVIIAGAIGGFIVLYGLSLL